MARRALLPHDFTIASLPFRGEAAVYFLLHSPSLPNFSGKAWLLATISFFGLRQRMFGLSSPLLRSGVYPELVEGQLSGKELLYSSISCQKINFLLIS